METKEHPTTNIEHPTSNETRGRKGRRQRAQGRDQGKKGRGQTDPAGAGESRKAESSSHPRRRMQIIFHDYL
jgi:hypothetical protein